MKLVAVIETKLWKGTFGESLHTDNEVERENSWIYYAGGWHLPLQPRQVAADLP